ncbi:hypothetical protein IV203_009236 [Nitzschia inconspicua]|uniref:Uncharacterized protein n=1 Tax=Nitzschia inconspicua TaxID=303405 RepID=A0A9K3K891_9STRA|nr:hypothetical protein IV203_011043 [Nitzschia inconspicua]KAG7353187.1 hypothetical protein IV203_009236 [Nitzschia inconspicua]
MMAVGTSSIRSSSVKHCKEKHMPNLECLEGNNDGETFPPMIPSCYIEKKTSKMAKDTEEATVNEDMESEGSLCVEDLLNDQIDRSINSSSSNESNNGDEELVDQLECFMDRERDVHDKADSGIASSRISKSPTNGSMSASRKHRLQSKTKKNWENLSSSTTYSAVYESCAFDVSSRSLLENCDFGVECLLEGGVIPVVRFSAGNVLASSNDASLDLRTKGMSNFPVTPMGRITEHTRESSPYGSQSDISGRQSFASATSPGVLGSCHKRFEARKSGEQSEQPPYSTRTFFSNRKCDILNIHDLKSLFLSGD